MIDLSLIITIGAIFLLSLMAANFAVSGKIAV